MDEPQTTVLLRRAQHGDLDGQSALISRLDPLLRAQARYRIARHCPGEDTDDLLQEVWLRALPRLPDLRERAGRRTPVLLRFLASTLLHRVQELLRARIRRPAAGLDPSHAAQLAAETRGMVTRIVAAERDELLWERLMALAPGERELLVLRGIEQQDNRAVAEHLGETPNAVSLRYNRLLQRLRDQLQGTVLADLAREELGEGKKPTDH